MPGDAVGVGRGIGRTGAAVGAAGGAGSPVTTGGAAGGGGGVRLWAADDRMSAQARAYWVAVGR